MLNDHGPGVGQSAPRCGARARTRDRQPCQAHPVKGKRRCRMYGGMSTGPRTHEGLERSKRANWKHGRYSQTAIEARRIANYETFEAAMKRMQRESRRAERQSARDVRRIIRAFDQVLGKVK
jgi:hypothetical protein